MLQNTPVLVRIPPSRPYGQGRTPEASSAFNAQRLWANGWKRSSHGGSDHDVCVVSAPASLCLNSAIENGCGAVAAGESDASSTTVATSGTGAPLIGSCAVEREPALGLMFPRGSSATAEVEGRLRVAGALGERCADLPLGGTAAGLEAAGALDGAASETVAGTTSFGGATATGPDATDTISLLGVAAGATRE